MPTFRIKDEDRLVAVPYCGQDTDLIYGELTEAPQFFTIEVRALGRRLNIHERLPVNYRGVLYYVRRPPAQRKALASVEV